MKITYKALMLISLVLFADRYAQGQTENDSISLDESIVMGKLKNGLTYFIKPLKKENEKLRMSLHVRAGSFKEKQHEIDFAHIIEHLAFRASENFPKGLARNSEILSGLNMTSANVFANTGGNVTAYWFDPPKDNYEAISSGLKWFKDISNGLDMSEESINRERGVVLQEYLAGEATQNEYTNETILHSKLFPCLTSHENFTEHNQSFPYYKLEQFYTKWYRPDRIAVSIVGNIKDVDRIEQMLREYLSSIGATVTSPKEKDCGELYFNAKPGFAVVKTNPNSLHNSYRKPVVINLFFRDLKTWNSRKKIGGIKRRHMGYLIAEILNQRFDKTEKIYKNFSEASSIHSYDYKGGSSWKPVSAFKLSIQAELYKEREALQKVITTLAQLKKFGITNGELDQAKKTALEYLNPAAIETMDYWKKQIQNNFIENEALPSGKNALLREWAAELTTENMNEFINNVISEMPEDIGIIIPEGHNSFLNSERNIRKEIRAAFQNSISPYATTETPSTLMSNEEINELQVDENLYAEKGEMESIKYQLKNGVEIILKPVNSGSKSQNIYLQGFTPYGASCFPDGDYYSAIYAPLIIKNMGVGSYTKFDLESFYRNTKSMKTGVLPYITYNESGFKGEIVKEELEDFLQLVYLYVSRPRKDQKAFEDWKKAFLNSTAATINPINDLMDAMHEQTKDFSKLPYASKNISAVETVNFEKALDIYKTLFGRAENFTFILTGDFKESEILPLLQKYLGNLPNKEQPACPEGNRKSALEQGPGYSTINPSNLYTTQNSYYGITFIRHRVNANDWKEELKVEALGWVLHKLVYGLRSDKELSLYHFTAGGGFNRIMNRYELMFRFNCVPEELPVIQKFTGQIIEVVKKEAFSEGIFTAVKNELLSRFNKDVGSQPSKISEKLFRNARYKEPIVCPSEVEDYIRLLTPEDISVTARRYLQNKNKYEVVIENEEG